MVNFICLINSFRLPYLPFSNSPLLPGPTLLTLFYSSFLLYISCFISFLTSVCFLSPYFYCLLFPHLLSLPHDSLISPPFSYLSLPAFLSSLPTLSIPPFVLTSFHPLGSLSSLPTLTLLNNYFPFELLSQRWARDTFLASRQATT